MKTPRLLQRILLLAVLALGPSAALAQGTAFTYQGVLNDGGAPASGVYDLRFRLFSVASAGSQLGSQVVDDVPVTNGLFTVTLDFGAEFPGNNRWLQIAVRPGASTGSFTILDPRQALTPVPYAIYSGGIAASNVSGTLPATTLSGVDGSGLTTLNASSLSSGTVVDARLSANVALRSGGNTFSGNQIITSGNVGIGTNAPSTVLHVVRPGDTEISLQSADNNRRWTLQASGAADGSGLGGTFQIVDRKVVASRLLIATNGNVGIGTTTPRAKLEVSDGATSLYVIPGQLNGNSNVNAVTLEIPGANTLGVWDNLSVANHLGVGESLTVAGEITTVAVNITSDRNAKEEFAPVNARDILAKVAALPITEWQYKTHGDARHIGPMAQDFRAAFGTGRDDKHITSVDADGVALAAIQGLNEVVREKDAELGRLKAENRSIAERLSAIERALELKALNEK